MDRLTPEKRSANMAKIRSKNTRPEITVRKLLHSLGYRYRLYYGDLPGKPDIVFPARQKVIFVHGCFWHQHEGCPDGHIPKSNSEFWKLKLERNVNRDSINKAKLIELGWEALVVWECEIKRTDLLVCSLVSFLGSVKHSQIFE